MDAQAVADVAGIWEGAQDDVKTVGSFLNGCFGEARGLEEATRNCGVTDCVEGGRGFGLVGSDGGVWFERCGGGDLHFKSVLGAFPFVDAPPAEGGGGVPGKRRAVQGS